MKRWVMMVVKFLIGGSPCTHWSIAQSKNRETTAEGIGWELFRNFLIAKEKFRPDFFLYENNKSAAQPIKDQISRELGAPLQYINSALVSAQNRQRFYCHNFGYVPQPADRGILLRDILESGVAHKEKAYTLRASGGNKQGNSNLIRHIESGGQYGYMGVAEPIALNETANGKSQTIKAQYGKNSATNAFYTSTYGATMVAEPIGTTVDGKAYGLKANYGKSSATNFMNGGGHYPQSGAIEPVRIGTIENDAQNPDYDSQQYRVYSPFGKSVTICGQGGGVGAKTGLYATPVAAPVGTTPEGKSYALTAYYSTGQNPEHTLKKHIGSMVAEPFKAVDYKPLEGCDVVISDQGIRCAYKGTGMTAQGYNVQLPDSKMRALLAGQNGKEKVIVPHESGSDLKPVYRVHDGRIEIKGKQYPIKLPDGHYIIRKLTVTECCRLQTMPDDYCRAVSATQAYRGLGNGWTAEVIIHLLSHALRGIPKDEEIIVLSLYDGIGTGRYCFDTLGYKNIRYYAYEIDKYPIQISASNYSDIIQCGDAFAVREDDWTMEGCGAEEYRKPPAPPLDCVFIPVDMTAAQLSFF